MRLTKRGLLESCSLASLPILAEACGFAARPSPLPTPDTGSATPIPRRASRYSVAVWTWGDGPLRRALARAVEEFNAATGDIQIRLDHQMAALSAPEYADRVLESIAAGDSPDLFHVQGTSWQPQAVQGFLQPLDDWSSRDNWSEAWARDEAHELQTRVRGKRYVCPVSADPQVLWYAPHRFLEAGVPLPRPEWSYADFQDVVVQLTRRARDGQQLGYLWSDAYVRLFSWWRLAGHVEWDRIGDPRRAYWNTPAVTEALQFQLYDAPHRLRVAPTPEQLAAQPGRYSLGNGIAMQVGGLELAGWGRAESAAETEQGADRNRSRLIAAQLLPRGRARAPHANLLAGFAMTRAAKDKEAAWEALRWIGGEAGQARIGAAGLICNTTEAATKHWLPLARQQPAIANPEMLLKACEGASIHVVGELGQSLEQDAGLAEAIASIRDGRQSARAALDALQPRVQRLLDSYWKSQERRG